MSTKFPVIMEMAYVLHSKFIEIPNFLLDLLVTSISDSLLHSLMNQHATFSAAFPSYQYVTLPAAFPNESTFSAALPSYQVTFPAAFPSRECDKIRPECYLDDDER